MEKALSISLMLVLGVHAFSQDVPPKQVPVLLIEQDTTEGATQSAEDAYTQFLAMSGYEATSGDSLRDAWNIRYPRRQLQKAYTNDDVFPEIPDAWDLLQVGKSAGLDYLCIIRVKYNAESVWASLGPKTKGTAIVDISLIDVKGELMVLRERDLTATSSRVERGWETAASLVVSAGFTAFSGGPKTPHLQKAVQLALAKAFQPLIELRTALSANSLRLLAR